jgi:hypothetical protein
LLGTYDFVSIAAVLIQSTFILVVVVVLVIMRVAARGYQAQIDERAAEYGGSPIYGLAGWA